MVGLEFFDAGSVEDRVADADHSRPDLGDAHLDRKAKTLAGRDRTSWALPGRVNLQMHPAEPSGRPPTKLHERNQASRSAAADRGQPRLPAPSPENTQSRTRRGPPVPSLTPPAPAATIEVEWVRAAFVRQPPGETAEKGHYVDYSHDSKLAMVTMSERRHDGP